MAFPFLLAATLFTAGSQFLSSKSNQRNAEAEASYQITKSKLEEERFRRDASRLQGRQGAVLNKSGRSMTEGTGAALLAEQVGEDELDAMIIRYGGQVASQRASMAASQFKNQSIMGPLSTILGGMNQGGMFGGGSGTAGNISGSGTSQPIQPILNGQSLYTF